jgi:plasmid stability protein
MRAIHVRNVPESLVAALRERAAQRRRSVQREILEILQEAVTKPLTGEALPPIRLARVRTPGRSTWRREEIYGDQGR